MGSRKEEERNEKIIRGLMKLPPNRRCINCNSLVKISHLLLLLLFLLLLVVVLSFGLVEVCFWFQFGFFFFSIRVMWLLRSWNLWRLSGLVGLKRSFEVLEEVEVGIEVFNFLSCALVGWIFWSHHALDGINIIISSCWRRDVFKYSRVVDFLSKLTDVSPRILSNHHWLAKSQPLKGYCNNN